ncbi:MAG TPA: ABC transporter permease, partial [Caldilineaceae bacterium]|nr:ABC transporter permease [Caldilineaceae bacterium]
MKIIRYLGIALESIRANKLRGALTMLGIIIGVAAVLTTLGIGSGAARNITSQVQSQGTNLLTVSAGGSSNFGNLGGGGNNVTTLTMGDVAALADPRVHPEISAVAPDYTSQATLTNEGQSNNAQVVGTTPDYVDVRNLTFDGGRFFTNEEVNSSAPVIVLGATLASNLFPSGNPLGQTIRVNSQPFQVVGVLKATGGAGFGSNDQRAFIPLSVAQGRLFNAPRYRGVYTISSMSIHVNDASQMDLVQQQVEQTLRLRHGLNARDDNDFTIFNQASLLQVAGTIAQTLSVFLGSIGAVSLLVGGIGIMNIMLVSVTERTREIGLRRALGAHDSDILLQFVIEALMLCTLGGLIGMGMSFG